MKLPLYKVVNVYEYLDTSSSIGASKKKPMKTTRITYRNRITGRFSTQYLVGHDHNIKVDPAEQQEK